ncbi:DUF1579 domain-containing protein [Hanstruepera marina]|uniref:DUF1579 domain-containing protein n=1 Tax=Hanstruepera marina TaxID=2873265 RepID=UPI001CA6266C|nr:DUF1579 domain-containing protein [Hanstruepera marina]
MKHLKTTLLLLTLFILSHLLNAQSEGLKKIDFFIGEWSIESVDILPNGTYQKSKAKSIVKYILDGYAIQDDFLSLDKNNNIVFRGTSIRSYNPRTNKYQIVWIMPGYKGITDISAELKDGKLVSTGKGYDYQGDFLERFEYYDIKNDSYKFKMDRSYDNGKTWIENFGRFTATRIK